MNDDVLRTYLIFIVVFFGVWGVMEASKQDEPQQVVVVTQEPTPAPTTEEPRQPTALDEAVGKTTELYLWLILPVVVVGFGVFSVRRFYRSVMGTERPDDPRPPKPPRDRPSHFGGDQ